MPLRRQLQLQSQPVGRARYHGCDLGNERRGDVRRRHHRLAIGGSAPGSRYEDPQPDNERARDPLQEQERHARLESSQR
jgi:hypothetical protein